MSTTKEIAELIARETMGPINGRSDASDANKQMHASYEIFKSQGMSFTDAAIAARAAWIEGLLDDLVDETNATSMSWG